MIINTSILSIVTPRQKVIIFPSRYRQQFGNLADENYKVNAA